MNCTWALVLVIALLAPCEGAAPSKPEYSTDLETELRSLLFSGYEVLQRPGKKVNVKVALNLLTVNDLNIKEQTMSISGYFSLIWQDTRLDWTNQTKDYSNIPFLFSSQTYVWRPALLIDNAVNDLTVISDVNIPMRIINNGFVTWNPAGVFIVACESDITYYPLDIQECTLSVSSWSYTSNEIELVFDADPFEMDAYSPNGEWELVETKGTKAGDRSRGGQSFSNLKFIIKMRRRPTFHVLNTLFPVALLAVLSAMVFKLPADSGEKIGYALTVLLAYAVYLTLISDNIPSTSVNICFLSIYLALILSYGTISVLCTIFVLNIHHRSDEEEIPRWLELLTRHVFMKVGCWSDACCCFKSKRKVSPQSPVMPISIEKKSPPKQNGNVEVFDDDLVSVNTVDEELTWLIISAVLDKFFFVMFMALILLSSLIVFGLLLVEYISV